MLRKVCWAAQAPTQHSTLNIQHLKKMTNTKGTLKYRKIQRTPSDWRERWQEEVVRHRSDRP